MFHSYKETYFQHLPMDFGIFWRPPSDPGPISHPPPPPLQATQWAQHRPPALLRAAHGSEASLAEGPGYELNDEKVEDHGENG